MTTYTELENLTVKSGDGLNFAYRDTGGDGRPVVLFQHFRGNLDNWDPALIDDLAVNKRVITFDYEGVGGSEGRIAHTIAETAEGSLRFLDAMSLEQVDILGFSIGSFVAQEIALTRPSIAKGRARIVGPKGCPWHAWMGRRGDRRGGHASDVTRGVRQRLLCAIRREQTGRSKGTRTDVRAQRGP